MKKNIIKMNIVLAMIFLIAIVSSACTVDSFGIEKGSESYTRMNEEVNIPDLLDESRVVNWVLNENDIKEFSIFDELGFVEKVMINNSFAGLFAIEDSKVKMDLVKTLAVSDNGREYTLELRDSYWSDGSMITAYDVINSWEKYSEKSGMLLLEKIGVDSVKALDKQLIRIKLSRSNDNILYYLSDLSYRVYSDELLDGAKLIGSNDNIRYSGKYLIRQTDEIESLKLIKNMQYYDAKNYYINELHIISSDFFNQNQNDRYEFYIDSSQAINEYKKLLIGADDFNYVSTGIVKSLIINPKANLLEDKYDRIKLLRSIDMKGVSDYSSKGLATIIDTFAVIDNWKFDYGSLEEEIIARQDNNFDFESLELMYIDSPENQMIYEILSLMFSTNYNINLTSDLVSKDIYMQKIKDGNYQLILKDIDSFGILNDRYLLNLESNLPSSYADNFDYEYKKNIKTYQHTSDIKYLKKAELILKLKSYIYPMYNCGFPIMGDERLDLKEFYNSYYLDFSTIKYK